MERDGNYLELVSNQAVLDGTLAKEDLDALKIKLWRLLGQRVERHTMGDSSSVPVETAEELFKSICFTIGLQMKASGKSAVLLLKTADMQELLRAGWAEIESQIEIGKKLLQKVKDSTPQIENISYRDTLTGIESFFKKYDYLLFAHEIPCDIDYQLCHPVPDELQGIEYINEYLRHLLIESQFCGHFDTGKIIMLLESHCPGYKVLLINLYEPVAVNAIGLAMLDGDILALDISERGRGELCECFQGWTKTRAIEELKRSADKLYHSLYTEDVQASEYLQRTAIELYPRIEAALTAGRFEGVFYSLLLKPAEAIPDIKFVDGEIMDDEDLRKLIDEISSCRFVSDKIVIVKQEVHSLRDLVEVLNIGFWEDDCPVLFDALQTSELALLLQFLHNQQPEWHSESGWELQLLEYARQQDDSRKSEIGYVRRG
jgi:hypothetical protein